MPGIRVGRIFILAIWCLRRPNYGWVWPFSVSPVPENSKIISFQKTGPKSGRKRPYVHSLWDGDCFFGVWNRTIVLLDRRAPFCSERMNTSHGQKTSIIIFITYICTHRVQQQREGGRLAWHMVCTTPFYYLTKAWPVWRGPGKGGQSHAGEGWQGAEHR